MPNYWPLSSGNWSNLSNWLTANTAPFNASVLPTATDDVYANNKIIYVDGNYQVSSVRNISATNITAGGSFVLNDSATLSAFLIGGGVNDVACVRFLSGEGTSATIFGSLCAGDVNAPVSRPIAVQNLSAGILNIFGNSLGGWKDISSSGDLNSPNNGIIINSESGNINLVGNYIGDLRVPVGSIDNNYPTIRNHSTGNIFLTGIVMGGAGRGSCGIYNHSEGNVSVVGTVSAGGVNQAHGIRNQSSGNVSISGTITTRPFQSLGDLDTAAVTMFSDSTLFLTGNVLNPRTGTYGIILKNNSNAFILGNIIYNLTTGRGIKHDSTGTLSMTGNVFGSCGPTAIGIFAINDGNIFLKGNLFFNTGFARHIYLSGGNSPVYIQGNIETVSLGIFSENTINTRNIYLTGNIVYANRSGILGKNLNIIMVGNISSASVFVEGHHGISSSGKIFIYGSVSGGVAKNRHGIDFESGTIFLSGQCVGGSGNSAFGINNKSGGIVSIFGIVSGGSGPDCYGVSDTNGEIIVDGSVIGGNGAVGIFSNGVVKAKKAIGNNFGIGSGLTNYFPAICANHTFVEEIECGAGGVFPVTGRVYLTKTNNSSAIYRNDALGKITMFTSSSANLLPIPRDVRFDVKYDFENLTGTLSMPDPEFVKLGQITDNTVGEGTILDGGIVWNTPLSAVNINESMGERTKKIITIEEMGEIIKDLS